MNEPARQLAEPRYLRLFQEEERPLVRPTRRGECVDGPRPCPWVSCRYHLMLHVDPQRGHIYQCASSPDEMAETCALDVAARGEHTSQEVAELLGIGPTRAQKVEVRALDKLEAAWPEDAP